MDLVTRSMCHVCEHVFCCPDHRRKHETDAHGFRRSKIIHRPRQYRRTESFALLMRKSFLYLEEKKTTVDQNGRKRKIMSVTKTVVEKSATKVEHIDRKILEPMFRSKEKAIKMLSENMEDLESRKEWVTAAEEEAKRDMVAELISPVEHTAKDDAAKNFVSPGEENMLEPYKVFTTSTPLPEQANKMANPTQTTPVQSVRKSALRLGKGVSSLKRKVTFSETVDSLYTSAKNETPVKRGGILSSVANAFQAAIHTIAGNSESCPSDQQEDESSPTSSKRIRRSSEFSKPNPPSYRIQGRRPLYNNKDGPSKASSLKDS